MAATHHHYPSSGWVLADACANSCDAANGSSVFSPDAHPPDLDCWYDYFDSIHCDYDDGNAVDDDGDDC